MTASMRHPWHDLLGRQHIDVQWPQLAVEILADTDGQDSIRIDPRLTQVARRCALDHELAHIDLGHIGGCNPAGERAARQLSARRLIPLVGLAQAMAATLDLDDVAEDCWVIRDVLDDRLAGLTQDEHWYLTAATAHHRTSS